MSPHPAGQQGTPSPGAPASRPRQVLQDMGLPTGAEGRDSSKGEDSAEETEPKPAVVAPPPVVETVSTPSAAFPADTTAEVSAWWAPQRGR